MKARAVLFSKGVLGGAKICTWCLGRQYASSQSQIEEVGHRTAKRLGLTPSRDCELCGNAFERRRVIEDKIADELGKIEFGTFQVGVTLSNEVVEREDEMRSKLRLSSGISLKKGLTTMFRKDLSEKLGRVPSLRSPEVTVRIDLPGGSIHVECKPVTFYVQYLKTTRGVPVRAIPCPICGGSGCETCEWTGIAEGDNSVEATLVDSFRGAFGGDKVRISWSGIEDDSSLLIGSGRPAFIEVGAPTRRRTGLWNLDMAPTKDIQLTKVELAPLNRSRIEDLVKEAYVVADFERDLNSSEITFVEQAYRNRILEPAGDRKRPRRVYWLKIEAPGRRAPMRLELDNGISLKHLLAIKSGSGEVLDRVQPTFADLLPTNRIVSAQVDIVRFRKLPTEEKH